MKTVRSICENKKAHRLYKAIGVPCPCMQGPDVNVGSVFFDIDKQALLVYDGRAWLTIGNVV